MNKEFILELGKAKRWNDLPDVSKIKGHIGIKIVTFIKKINSCYHNCPHFTIQISLECEIMICKHPNAKLDGHIIEHPECVAGFPEKCPLWNE